MHYSISYQLLQQKDEFNCDLSHSSSQAVISKW